MRSGATVRATIRVCPSRTTPTQSGGSLWAVSSWLIESGLITADSTYFVKPFRTTGTRTANCC